MLTPAQKRSPETGGVSPYYPLTTAVAGIIFA
jgi:hypothetical protein